jgi:anti-anti-sigma regulatory factor
MLTINQEQFQDHADVAILSLHGDLDASNYQELVARAAQASQSGARSLLLDMSQLRFMSSAGMAALHSLVRMMRGEVAHDMQYGWNVFHQMERDIHSGSPSPLKICSLQPNVSKSLELTGINRLMEIYADLPSALASLPS